MLINPLYGDVIEAGVDEAGRGALAGDLYAAAVILPVDFRDERLNDSKALTHKQRILLRDTIVENAVAWAVGVVTAKEVDEINVLNGSFLAMERAVLELAVAPELLLIDGNRFRARKTAINYECIVKGDSKVMSIAAASILAKTYRDEHMKEMAKKYPHYGWSENKGYPTKQHREAIAQFGISDIHRKSYKGCEDNRQPKLF